MLKLHHSGYISSLLVVGLGLGATACAKAPHAASEAPARSMGASSASRGGTDVAMAREAAPAAAKKEKHAAADSRDESPAFEDAEVVAEEREELPPANQFPKAGRLTAGIWDDNLNLETFLGYRSELTRQDLAGLLPIPEFAHRETASSHSRRPRNTIDISFVIDATGSMGDEISYLQSEFLSLSREIEERYSNSEQRWSLVVYRDRGDDYVVRNFSFEDSPTAFRRQLARQSAGGGGDYPEAAHEGLAAAVGEQWRTGANTARLLFWVADAPHHNQQARAVARAIHTAHQKDVHIYPVASSGVDELTEFTMRSAAQLTGGRYIFLTDDSGVGYSHKEPTIPCYHVTSLRDAILRSVAMEMSGRYQAPRREEIIRTTGAPDQGRCLDAGQASQGQPGQGDWGLDNWERRSR